VEKILTDAASLDTIVLQGQEWKPANLENEITACDILVNCTSIGMHPDTDQTPVPKELLHKGLVVHDIVYNPLQTRLLKEAQEAGCTTIDGLGMLIHQGIASFEIWTGQTPPLEPLRQVALNQLNKKQ
jgi:shikimate dehydrogenase